MDSKKEDVVYLERKTSKSRYDKRFILKIVSEIESGMPKEVVEKRYGIRGDRVLIWLRTYGSQEYVLKADKIYTTSEKRSVIRAIEGGMSIKEAVITFNISNHTVVRRWLRAFEKENSELSLNNVVEMPKDKFETPSEKEKALIKALEEVKLKNKALDTLIDIAEEQFKINIRKKSGAKQS